MDSIPENKDESIDTINLQNQKEVALNASIAAIAPPADQVEDKIVCAIKTNERYLIRAVERRKKYWYNNTNKFSGGHGIYDIKFEFQDQPSDYSHMRPCQMFNHFQFNTEITTKSGLCKALYNNGYPGMKVDSWFPRCYDLS